MHSFRFEVSERGLQYHVFDGVWLHTLFKLLFESAGGLRAQLVFTLSGSLFCCFQQLSWLLYCYFSIDFQTQ